MSASSKAMADKSPQESLRDKESEIALKKKEEDFKAKKSSKLKTLGGYTKKALESL